MALRLTYRALADLEEIKASSIEKHGPAVTSKYISDIEDALTTIAEYPNILTERPFATHTRFFPVHEHMLVFAVLDDALYLLTIKYGKMDIEKIITRFEPALVHEAEAMHKRLKNK